MVLNERWAVTAGGDEVGLAGGELRRGQGVWKGAWSGTEVELEWNAVQSFTSGGRQRVCVEQRVETAGMRDRAGGGDWLGVDKAASSVIKPACETIGLRLAAEEQQRAERAVIGQAKNWQWVCTTLQGEGRPVMAARRAAGGRCWSWSGYGCALQASSWASAGRCLSESDLLGVSRV